ncbi:MAG TPA: hypothetical protein VHX86_12935 [Tepidisphaeraceae bacterium]|jgi:archaellum component FlaC|nr:hypothetical protein [Tepidisphaeraceae bacterium]
MHKLSAGITALSLTLALAGFSLLNGCGAADQADHAAQKAVQTADASRSSAQSLDDLDGIQKTYDNLASDRSLSAQMQVLVRSRQTQLRLQRITMMTADLRSDESQIVRDIDDIERLGMQIAAAQASVVALKAYDPGSEIEKLKAQEAEIQGSVDKLTWVMPNATEADPNGKVTSPTLFAVTHEIEMVTNDIQRNQENTVAARKVSAAKGNEAEMYLRKAEGESGMQQVTDSTAAADDRRDAALADSKADVLQVELQRLQAALDQAKGQQGSLQAAVKTLDSQIEAQQTRWTDISDQIQAQQKMQQGLIGAQDQGQDTDAVTVGRLARNLSQQLQDAAVLREKVNNELSAVIPQLNGVISECNKLRSGWIQDLREKQDDPDAIIWRQAEETLHPAYFSLQMASAMQTKASVEAAKTRIDLMIAQMLDGYQVNPAEAAGRARGAEPSASKPIRVSGLTALLDPQKVGTALPAAFLGDIAKADPDQLKQQEDDTTKAFDDAVQAYTDSGQLGATDSGPAADERRNVALMGQAEANRQAARFAQLIGDSDGAEKYLHAADEADSQVDPSFRLLATAANSSTPQKPAAPGSAP